MKKIVQVKHGIIANVVTIAFLVILALGPWWIFRVDGFSRIVFAAFSICMFGGCFLFIRNIIHPKSASLAIEGDTLIWSVRTVESSPAAIRRIPLNSLRTLEFVLPKIQGEVNSRNHVLSELFIIDVHGTRHRMPMELWPGVNRKKIVAALQAERPEIRVVESIDGD